MRARLSRLLHRGGAPAGGIPAASRRFLRDKRGIATIEFVLIVPLLFAFYFLVIETAQAIDTSRKVNRVASMVADLVAQQDVTTPGEIDAIMEIGESIMQPYRRSPPQIMVTAIEIVWDDDEEENRAQVVWSRKMVNGVASTGEEPGSYTTVPDNLMTKGSFYIRARTELDYVPMILWSEDSKRSLRGLAAMTKLESLHMGDRYYLLPRQSPAVICTGCALAP